MPDTIALDMRLSYGLRGNIWAFLVAATNHEQAIAMAAFESGEFFSQSLDVLLEDHPMREEPLALLRDLRGQMDEVELPIVIAHFLHNFFGGAPA